MAWDTSEQLDLNDTLQRDNVPLIDSLWLDAKTTGDGALAASRLDRFVETICAHSPFKARLGDWSQSVVAAIIGLVDENSSLCEIKACRTN